MKPTGGVDPLQAAMDGVDPADEPHNRIEVIDEELTRGQSMTDLSTNTLGTSMWGDNGSFHLLGFWLENFQFKWCIIMVSRTGHENEELFVWIFVVKILSSMSHLFICLQNFCSFYLNHNFKIIFVCKTNCKTESTNKEEIEKIKLDRK